MSRASTEWFLVALICILSVIGDITSRTSALAHPLLSETAADLLDGDGEADAEPVSWLVGPSSAADRLDARSRYDYLSYLSRNSRYAPDVTSLTRDKKYKLSFYDCISLYCGERIGPDRGKCILKFCHRTK